jgi:hypothetical protein
MKAALPGVIVQGIPTVNRAVITQADEKGPGGAAVFKLLVEGYDLRMDEMTGIVREFAQKLDGAKAGVVYYAGHGIAVGDENYLIPVDASLKSEADLDFRAVNVQLILRQMQRDERVNVLILDACRDNPFTTQLAARSRSVSRGLTAIETQSASGILIAFATDPRATALDGEKDGNSPFTSALLKHSPQSQPKPEGGSRAWCRAVGPPSNSESPQPAHASQLARRPAAGATSRRLTGSLPPAPK